MEPTYLGDGVYASFDGYMIALHVNRHDAEPAVYLEPQVFSALVAYRAKCFNAAQSSGDTSPEGT